MQSVLHFPEETVAAAKKVRGFWFVCVIFLGAFLLPFLTYLRLASMEKFAPILIRNL